MYGTMPNAWKVGVVLGFGCAKIVLKGTQEDYAGISVVELS